MIDGVVAVSLADLIRMPEFRQFYKTNEAKRVAEEVGEVQYDSLKADGKQVMKVGDEYYRVFAIPATELVDRFLSANCDTKPSSTRLVRDPENPSNTRVWQRTLDYDEKGGNKSLVFCQRWVSFLNGVPTWDDVMKAAGTMKR